MQPSFLRLFTLLPLVAYGLRITPRSPCAEFCEKPSTNTTGDDIVCRDGKFFDTEEGTRFRKCVSCELESTHHRLKPSESDVEWGFYNLRYALSSCMFGFPANNTPHSSPCDVSCDLIKDALAIKLKNPEARSVYDFCGVDDFSNKAVTQCAVCYSMKEDEKIVGNFLEAVRQGCNNKSPLGTPFVIKPDRIFNTTTLPISTTTSTPGDAKKGGKPKHLVLIIVLSIVGFLILLLVLGIGCCFWVRRRRRRAKRNSDSGHLHERWHDTSMMTPVEGGLTKYWGAPTPVQANYGYDPGFDPNACYAAQPDVKYPVESYELSSVSPVIPTPPEDGKTAQMAPVNVPRLSAPPPGRKSVSST